MQRATWSDERLDDLSNRMDAGFLQVGHRFEIVDHRFDEVDRRFAQVDQRFEQVDRRLEQFDRRFEQVDHRLGKMMDGIIDLHKSLNRIGAGIIVSLAGIIVASLLNGAA